MKRKLSIIIALSAALTMLAACGNANESETEQSITEESVSETESVSASAETESETVQETTTVITTEATTVTTEETTAAAAEETTVSEAVTTTEETTTKEIEVLEYKNVEMPVPFVNEGGDLNSTFYSTVNSKLDYISMQFVHLVGTDIFKEWLNASSSSKSEYTSISELANIYSFVKHFEIPDDTVRELLIKLRGGYDDDFTDEDIEIFLSGDDEAVAQHFSADTTIVKGSNVYSLKWVYYHTQEDYEAAGITAQELEAFMPMYDKVTLTAEAKSALTEKIDDYIAVNNMAEVAE